MANLEDEKMNPGQALICLAVLFIAVILFCVIVWKVTHADRGSNMVVTQNTEESMDMVSGLPSEEDEPESPDSYLSSDEDYDDEEPDESPVDSEVAGMTFTAVNDMVTAKDTTNLRSEPSTTGGKATVVTQLKNGVYAKRVGINDATGWSKLEYNGETLYAVTQYLILQEDNEDIASEE